MNNFASFGSKVMVFGEDFLCPSSCRTSNKTINKAQVQMIPHMEIYLPQHVLSYGQSYIGLSRGIYMATTDILVELDIPNHTKIL